MNTNEYTTLVNTIIDNLKKFVAAEHPGIEKAEDKALNLLRVLSAQKRAFVRDTAKNAKVVSKANNTK